MITIAKNTAIDHWRKLQRIPLPIEDTKIEDTCQNVEELYIDTENFKELLLCLSELDDIYLDVLNLKILHHLSSKHIAEILNISEVNVFYEQKKSLQRSGRKRRDEE